MTVTHVDPTDAHPEMHMLTPRGGAHQMRFAMCHAADSEL